MKPRISMITLGVRDLAASVKFYEQGLGFPYRFTRIDGTVGIHAAEGASLFRPTAL